MPRRVADLSQLEQSLGHVFNNRDLLTRALTHISFLKGEIDRTQTYQRYEFLGDRVLGMVICDILLQTYPYADEGELSRRLALLVRKESCADIAAKIWKVGPYLKLGGGQFQSGGRKNQAVLADVCEALIGAVFLDGGYAAAHKVVQNAFSSSMHSPSQPLRDSKTALQEWAQGKGLEPPVYRLKSRSGPEHAPKFGITACVDGFPEVIGTGSSKRLAEQDAARLFLVGQGELKAQDA